MQTDIWQFASKAYIIDESSESSSDSSEDVDDFLEVGGDNLRRQYQRMMDLEGKSI